MDTNMAEDSQKPDIRDEVDTATPLIERVAKLEAELADANTKNLRLAADYQNLHRRGLANETQAKLQGAAGVVQSVLTVLDHFDLALRVDVAQATPQQVIEGVRVIRDEFMKVLVGHGVGVLAPKPGEAFDPGRHEAVMQQAVEGVGPGLIAACLQPGYTITVAAVERVIRPAKVAVTPAES